MLTNTRGNYCEATFECFLWKASFDAHAPSNKDAVSKLSFQKMRRVFSSHICFQGSFKQTLASVIEVLEDTVLWVNGVQIACKSSQLYGA